ncbi:MAG: nucleotidyltransferase family protein [Candidatus Margulisiibacteriota bacterium]
MKRENIDRQLLVKLFKYYGAEFLGVFGSRARGDFNKDSDLDIVVRFKERKSLIDIVRMERDISSKLGIKVDLLTENSISPYLKDKIEKDMEILHGLKR